MDHAKLGVTKLEPFLVQHNGKHYVGIVGAVVNQNNDVVDHVPMIIGPNKVVSVQPSSIYDIHCSLAPPRGYSWGSRAARFNNKTRFSVTKIMNRYWNTPSSDDEAAGDA